MASAEITEQSTPALKQRQNATVALFKNPALLTLLLAAATMALYLPVHHHPYINYDDNDYVYVNPHVQAGLTAETMRWAFTSAAASNWHPLTWLTHAMVYELFGPGPSAQHDANLLFHTLNVIVLFWVLRAATGFSGRSFMVAALFALHPVNVESVAWVAELKTTLSMLFFLLALGAYGWYARRPDRLRMAAVAFLFALGLMAKPQIITFPFVLLLWDYWPLRRLSFAGDATADAGAQQKSLRALILEKTPLFALMAMSAFITMHVQHGARSWFPHTARFGNAVLSYGVYVKNAVWPSKLVLLYPHPGLSIQWWKVLVSAVFLAAVTVFVVVHRRHRYLPVGWFWFLGTLVPMLGIVQDGASKAWRTATPTGPTSGSSSWCFGRAEFVQQEKMPTHWQQSALSCWRALALVARKQIDLWQVEEDLWRYTIANTSGNWLAESELGAALAMHGDVPQAVVHFNRAVALQS